MKRILLIAALFITANAFTQINSYTLLDGSINKYPVTMHLHQYGHIFLGYYYYNSTQQPIYFTGEDTSRQGEVFLTTNGTSETENFILSFSNKAAKGTWQQGDNNNTFNVDLMETQLPLQFTFEYREGEKLLRNSMKDSPAATFEASSVWPKGNSPTDVFIQTEIRKMFDDSSSNKNIDGILEKNENAFFKDYIESNSDMQTEDMGATLNYDVSTNLLISFQSSKILSLALDTYAYTGGAHGNYGTVYTSYDITQNKKLGLSDILNAAGIAKLQALLERNFRKQNDLQPTDALTTAGLFENEIKPNDNFYVTGKGINFAYTPYEIGPFAMGEVEIFISFKDLENYLQPGFKSLIN